MPDISVQYVFVATMVAFAVTYALRGFPFMAFGHTKETPKLILYIGKVISPAVIAVLIVYCLKGTHFFGKPYGIPEIASVIACIVLHKLLHNPLVSIVVSTALYMVLVQNIGS